MNTGGAVSGLFSSLCQLSSLAIVIVFALAIIRWIRRTVWLRELEPGGFYCKVCRYNVTRIGSWQCPECGADLKTKGIITHQGVPPASLAGRLISMTCVMIPVGTILTMAIVYSWPVFAAAEYKLVLEDRDNGRDTVFIVTGTGEYSNGDPIIHRIQVTAFHFSTIYVLEEFPVTDTKWLVPELWRKRLEPYAFSQDPERLHIYSLSLAQATNDVASQWRYTSYDAFSSVEVSRNVLEHNHIPVVVGLSLGFALWIVVVIGDYRSWRRQIAQYEIDRIQELWHFGKVMGLD